MELYTNQMQKYLFAVDEVKAKESKTFYSKSILVFDIEVTSAWLDGDYVIGYTRGKSAEYWNSLIPLALPYIWQFSCDGKVYYGRELRDFEKVLSDLPSNINYIIWVHNLSYEFQFLCNFLEWDNVFARSPHKPIKAVPIKYKNIEFRCSYMLTRLSLDAWGKQLGFNKATGDLDYDVIRTPLTEMSDKELRYCERDCLVVEKGISEYIKRYSRQDLIPLTQTGTVRREVKNRLMNDKKYSYFIKKLVPSNAVEYKHLQQIFAGGYTHANRWYAGKAVKGYIEHYDFSSSYPTVMISEKYPMSPWVYTAEHRIPSSDMFDNYAYIMHVKFRNIRCNTFNTYIQASKSICSSGKYDNGRVISADSLEIWITEQDWLTINNTYEWDDLVVLHLYESVKKYLPVKLTEYILELYSNKTELKDVDGMEDLYMQSKQYINSMFGMCVTAVVQAEVELHGDIWEVQNLTEELVNKKLKKLRYPNPREKSYFLSYSWGCWVTAYARRNLWKCIEKCDDDLLYCDTDSIFVVGKHNFDWYNDEVTNKLVKACDYMGLDFSKTRPKTKKGKEKPLGIFVSEDNCTEFKTLGAKRYVERRETDGRLHLTVSGINKEAVELLNDDINNFVDGFDFDKDAECVNKKLSTYINDMPKTTWGDGYISTYTHGINLRRTGYNLGVTDEYKELINYRDMCLEDIPEQFLINMRGRYVISKLINEEE